MFGVFVDVDHCKLPMYDWLPKLYKRHFKLHFVANSILNSKKNATVKFCHVLHVAHKHEFDQNLVSCLGVVLICQFCLPGMLANIHILYIL